MKPTSNRQKEKKHQKKKIYGRGPRNPLASPAFQQKVERLDKLMQLASSQTPKADPKTGLLLAKSEGGTLEQVGREADNAWAGVKRIMQLLNVEDKFIDYYSAANFNYTGLQLDLSAGITQGVGTSQRTGSSIKLTRVQVRFSVLSNGGSTNWSSDLVVSRDGNPSLADIYALSGAASAYAGFGLRNQYELKANPSHKHCSGFVIAAGLGVGNKCVETVVYDIKMDNHVEFSGSSATVTSGATTLNFISNLNAGVPTVTYHVRLFYVDN